jgi:hypothetical protein
MENIVKIAKITQFDFEMGSLTRKSLFSRDFSKSGTGISYYRPEKKWALRGVLCLTGLVQWKKTTTCLFWKIAKKRLKMYLYDNIVRLPVVQRVKKWCWKGSRVLSTISFCRTCLRPKMALFKEKMVWDASIFHTTSVLWIFWRKGKRLFVCQVW